MSLAPKVNIKKQELYALAYRQRGFMTRRKKQSKHGTGGRVMADLIDRQAAIDATLEAADDWDGGCNKSRDKYITSALIELPSAQPEQRWIPFKTRPLTEEEQDEHPEWNCILDCKLPDDGQAILVSIDLRGHERVQYDEFYTDDGSYLDSGYAIGAEATAWMPLPDPWGGEET